MLWCYYFCFKEYKKKKLRTVKTHYTGSYIACDLATDKAISRAR